MSPQVNLRLTPDLLNRLDSVAARYHISRSEWIRTTLARAARQEQVAPDELAVMAFASGKLSKEELAELLGPEEAERLILARELLRKGRTEAKALVAAGKL